MDVVLLFYGANYYKVRLLYLFVSLFVFHCGDDSFLIRSMDLIWTTHWYQDTVLGGLSFPPWKQSHS